MSVWSRLFEPLFRPFVRDMLVAEAVEDQPDTYYPGMVYMVGDEAHPWSASMLCPCKCGSIISLSRPANVRPRWRASRHFNGSVSLQPSVCRTKGCKSHFFVRHGRIVWASSQHAGLLRQPTTGADISV